MKICRGFRGELEIISMKFKSIAYIIFLIFTSNVYSVTYDIVINNGRVMDPETYFDAVRNVGIKEGRIVKISKQKLKGKEVIDATGYVVAPGFIDTHTHSSDKFVIKMAMMDGVTSGMDYELGALNIADWYAREKNDWPINFGQCVSHELVRMTIHDGLNIKKPVDAFDAFKLRAKSKEDGVEGWSVTVSNLEQINAINQRLDEELRQGALCIGSTGLQPIESSFEWLSHHFSTAL
jgi:hypothetical protein